MEECFWDWTRKVFGYVDSGMVWKIMTDLILPGKWVTLIIYGKMRTFMWYFC